MASFREIFSRSRDRNLEITDLSPLDGDYSVAGYAKRVPEVLQKNVPRAADGYLLIDLSQRHINVAPFGSGEAKTSYVRSCSDLTLFCRT